MEMKNAILRSVLSLLAVVAVGGPVRAQSSDSMVMDSSDLFYSIVDYRLPGVEVTYPNSKQSELWNGHEKPSGEIVFPMTIIHNGNQFEVIEISPWTFADCGEITSVTLTNHLHSIGFAAFARCTGIRTIDIPASVDYLGGCAFFACHTLESVSLPTGLKRIKAYTFADCPALRKIEIPAGVEAIGISAFDRSGLTEVTLPPTLKALGENAFRRCKDLRQVRSMNAEPPKVGEGAFSEIAPEAVLFVPRGSREAYLAAKGWDTFSCIEEY